MEWNEATYIFGFSSEATPTVCEVNAVFRELAAVFHPDRGGSDDEMRGLLEARDVLLEDVKTRDADAAVDAALSARYAKRRATKLEDPKTLEMQAFAERAKADIASCYLALPKIKKWGLTIHHPRAAMLARGEDNRSLRAEWASAVSMPARDEIASVLDAEASAVERDAMQVDETQIAPRFRQKAADKEDKKKWVMNLINHDDLYYTFAPGQVDEADEREQQITRMFELQNAVKPRDREVLELRFNQGLSINEIAIKLGKSRQCIYQRFDRMKPLLRNARERADWNDAHNALANGTGDAPVVLQKDGQLEWDLGDGPEVQP